MRLAVVGTGYVGLVAGAGFSDFGNDVMCVDVDARKIEKLNRGEVPIYEPGLDTLIARNRAAGRIHFSTDIDAAMKAADIVFIAVGTPPAADGSADLSAVFAVGERFAQNLGDAYKVLATKSTVPVGTADRLRAIVRERTQNAFGIASNPEFLKEGDAINDFMKPDRVIIGSDDDKAHEVLRHLYAPFVRTRDRIQTMDARSAELTKYAANALLATRISFMNDLALLAEKLGADIEHVRRGVGSDPRIGPKFLFPGPGYGGSCFPKDLAALLQTGKAVGHELRLVRAAEEINVDQKGVLGRKVLRSLGETDAATKTIAVWGLAFKPETDDIREAPALTLITQLCAAGFRVQAHDPQAMDNVREHFAGASNAPVLVASMYDAVQGADALVLVTEWREYRTPDFQRIKSQMRGPVVIDGRNLWQPEELRSLGFRYEGIGRASRTTVS